MEVHKFIVGKNFEFFTVNSYLIISNAQTIIIDPGDEWKKLKFFIETNNLTPILVICTHCHIDHIKDVKIISEYFNIPVAIGKYEKELLENNELNLSLFFNIKFNKFEVSKYLEDNEELNIGKKTLRIIHTPGHTPGSICIKGDNFILTGDTLFKDSIGRTDLPQGNYKQLINSISNKILTLPPEYIVYPGHEENTTIKNEQINFKK